MSDFTKKKTTDHDMIQLANRSFAKVVPLQIPRISYAHSIDSIQQTYTHVLVEASNINSANDKNLLPVMFRRYNIMCTLIIMVKLHGYTHRPRHTGIVSLVMRRSINWSGRRSFLRHRLCITIVTLIM